MSKNQVFVAKGFSPWYRSDWWDIGKVTNIDKSISGQVTVTCNGGVTDMGMFSQCCKLTSIDLSNFDTSKVTDMRVMFYGCSKLTTIKGVIDMKSCTEYYYLMFYKCPNLKGVKIKNPPANFEKFSGLSSSQYTVVS